MVELCEGGGADFQLLYPDDMGLVDKVRTIAQKIYGAADIALEKRELDQLAGFEAAGRNDAKQLNAKAP